MAVGDSSDPFFTDSGRAIKVVAPDGAPLEVADSVVATQQSRPTSMAVDIVSSVGAWHNVAITDWVAVDASTIAATSKVLELEVTEKSGTAPCFLLLRANASEATTAAWEIQANSSTSFNLRVGAGVTTISVYGTARLKAYLG